MEDDDDWDSRQFRVSRRGGRGFSSRDEWGDPERHSNGARGALFGSRHEAVDKGPYYQQGMLHKLLRVEPRPLNSPYLPSVQVRGRTLCWRVAFRRSNEHAALFHRWRLPNQWSNVVTVY